MITKVKVGDTVLWAGGFGSEPYKPAVVERMDVTEHPRCKYGEEVDEVDVELVKANRVLFTLENGHWAYSEQIKIVPQQVPVQVQAIEERMCALVKTLKSHYGMSDDDILGQVFDALDEAA